MLVGVKFSTPVQTVYNTHSAPVQWVLGHSRREIGRSMVLTTQHHQAPIVKERVEIYLYSLSVLSWHVTG